MILNVSLTTKSIQLITKHNSLVPQLLSASSDNYLKYLLCLNIKLEYGVKDDKDQIILKKAKLPFTYDEVELVTDFLIKHFTLSLPLKEKLLFTAWKEGFITRGFFCLYEKFPTFLMIVENSTIILQPVSNITQITTTPKFLNIINKLTENKLIYNYSTQSLILTLADYNFYPLTRCLLTALVENQFLDRELVDAANRFLEKKFFQQLAHKEALFLNKILEHEQPPYLKDYLDLAYKVENLFNKIADDKVNTKEDLDFVRNAIERKGEFLLAPQVILRGFFKLDKNFGNNLYNIINPSKSL